MSDFKWRKKERIAEIEQTILSRQEAERERQRVGMSIWDNLINTWCVFVGPALNYRGLVTDVVDMGNTIWAKVEPCIQCSVFWDETNPEVPGPPRNDIEIGIKLLNFDHFGCIGPQPTDWPCLPVESSDEI